jgi:heat shock protein HspQ
MSESARFYVGQVVHHLKFDYRGVIVDVDPEYQGTDDWYQQVALSQPPKDKPWYHVLVDNADHMTYVAERHLEADESKRPVSHPYIEQIFDGFSAGGYKRRERIN